MTKLKQRTQHTFDRISSCHGPYIDSEHFMGRSPFYDHWSIYSAPVNVKHEADRCIIEVGLIDFSKEEIELYIDDDSIQLQAIHRSKKRSG